MKKAILLAAATIATGLAALPVVAQSDDMAPARLERLDAQAKAVGYHILHGQALEIARANGMASVREIDLRKGDRWKVEGRDANGAEIELSGHDGKVLKVERD